MAIQKIIFLASNLKNNRLNKKLKKICIPWAIGKISNIFEEIEEYDLRDPRYINNLNKFPLPEELLSLLSCVLLKSGQYQYVKNTNESLNYLLKQIRIQGGGIKDGENDLHATLSRAYHQTHMLIQRCTLDSALNSIELQKVFFANGAGVSKKFFDTYGLSTHDFLRFLEEFLVLASDKKIFNLDSAKSLIDEGGKKIESFFNLISLDVKNANKVFNNWGKIHKMDFSSMKQDILTPFYPHPLLEYESEYMLYSRKLLYITAHYHLYDLMKKVDNDLGGFFESHIKISLQVYKKKNNLVSELICSGGTGGVRKKNADFVIKEGKDLILIEAKCTSPKNQDILALPQ